MGAPYSAIRSKLNRAIVAYLISLNNASVGDAATIQPENFQSSNVYPNTTIHALVGKPEVKNIGITRITVRVSIKGSSIEEVGTVEYEKARKAFDARIEATVDALMQTNDDQTLFYTAELITAAGRALKTSSNRDIAAANQDMADFTLTQWYDAGEGDGQPSAEGSSWEEIILFESVCCPSNVD